MTALPANAAFVAIGVTTHLAISEGKRECQAVAEARWCDCKHTTVLSEYIKTLEGALQTLGIRIDDDGKVTPV